MPELPNVSYRSALATCPTCWAGTVANDGTPQGVTCRCGRHFHFGALLWTRTDKCIVCPSCGHALSPLDFARNGAERDE